MTAREMFEKNHYSYSETDSTITYTFKYKYTECIDVIEFDKTTNGCIEISSQMVIEDKTVTIRSNLNMDDIAAINQQAEELKDRGIWY